MHCLDFGDGAGRCQACRGWTALAQIQTMSMRGYGVLCRGRERSGQLGDGHAARRRLRGARRLCAAEVTEAFGVCATAAVVE